MSLFSSLTMLAGAGHQGLDELSHPLLSHCTPGPYSPRNYLFRRSLAQRNLRSSPSSLRQPHCGMSSFSVAVFVFVRKQTWSPGPGGLCHSPLHRGGPMGLRRWLPGLPASKGRSEGRSRPTGWGGAQMDTANICLYDFPFLDFLCLS